MCLHCYYDFCQPVTQNICCFWTKGLYFSYRKLLTQFKLDYVLLKLTLRFGVIVVEVLFPLRCGELTHITDKKIFFVVAAEPV